MTTTTKFYVIETINSARFDAIQANSWHEFEDMYSKQDGNDTMCEKDNGTFKAFAIPASNTTGHEDIVRAYSDAECTNEIDSAVMVFVKK